MVIVDAWVHIWGPDTSQRPWAPGGATQAQRPVPLGKDEILRGMDAAGVHRVVIVPPSWEGDRWHGGLVLGCGGESRSPGHGVRTGAAPQP